VFWGFNANSQLFFPVSENSDCTLGGSSTSSFTPGGTYSTPLTVTTTSSAVALPAGTTVAVYNTGAQTAYVTLGVGAPTATTAQIAIAPGGAQGFTVGSNTYLAAITASGSTTLNIAGGSGLFTPYGGGGLTAQSTATTTDNNVSVTTSSTTVVPASSNIRMRVDISNNAVIGSGNDMWCRTDGGVATLNIGTKVYAGSGFEWLYPTVGPSAINCIMTNATVTVSYEAFQ
jgi:hypothetical protein